MKRVIGAIVFALFAGNAMAQAAGAGAAGGGAGAGAAAGTVAIVAAGVMGIAAANAGSSNH